MLQSFPRIQHLKLILLCMLFSNSYILILVFLINHIMKSFFYVILCFKVSRHDFIIFSFRPYEYKVEFILYQQLKYFIADLLIQLVLHNVRFVSVYVYYIIFYIIILYYFGALMIYSLILCDIGSFFNLYIFIYL